jgi:hypothetical protein
MEILLSSGFWSDQVAAAREAWAIFVLLILISWIGFRFKSSKTRKELLGLRAHTAAMESRLQLARDHNAGEAKEIAALRSEIDALRQSLTTKAKRKAAEPGIKEVEASAATLAMTNATTDHILTAKTLAIGGIEKKQRLNLVPRTGATS